ncbi:GH15443 [Drosophila grimshawi]|uniref:GH15443 n=2 Tax=Drosophila grimshawi TaxID=7222 RepID=B4J2F3_DROGR|nr:GH15443 [Drosophila grimshawi]
MALPRSLIYMFEFVIDDLLITKQNLCAPEEYPTCVEITFRSNVFLSICDREFGTCVNPKQCKCGKCVIFALDSPITDKDRLLIHVYKKKTNRCKFLIGLTELPMKPIFDRVKESFDAENINWDKNWVEQLQDLPKMKGPNKDALDNCSCYDTGYERREQLCPTSELTKRLLPLFNLCKQQTGNMVLIMRLLCNGPVIVSQFSLNHSICSRNPVCPPPCCEPCPPKPCPTPSCPSCGKIKVCCDPPPCCPEDPCDPCCNATGNTNATGGPMDTSKKCCKGRCPPCPPPQCVQPDPCYLPSPASMKQKCLRYFACNLDKMCPCEYCEDEFDRECPTVPSKRRCKSEIEQRLEPCGPCSGVPAHPRYIQVQKQKDMETVRKDKQTQDKEKKKSKGRQTGGCDDDWLPNGKDIFGGNSVPAHGAGSNDPCGHCCSDYTSCCDLARNRAIRQLRHLLVKYNIQV